ncbi:hypothetical protein N9R79_06430 [Vibrio sp.]|nr:hypothetical protein [Vibrio sp.]
MQYKNLRLVDYTKLTKQDTQYLVIPNELDYFLKQTRSLQPCIQPMFAQSHLAPYLQKTFLSDTDIRTLITSLDMKRLAILNSMPRRSQITHLDLKPYPHLQSAVSKAQLKSPKTTPNYQPTLVEPTLTPEPIRSDQEINTDYKIVVEVAGQLESLHHQFSLYKTRSGEDYTRNQTVRKDPTNPKRSLVEFKGIPSLPRSLSMTIPLFTIKSTLISFPVIKECPPVPIETKKEEWDTVFIPVLPIKENESGEQSLYQSGYFYVLWNGKVWRELKLGDHYRFHDVQLDYWINKSPKPATGVQRYINLNIDDIYPDCYLAGSKMQIDIAGKKIEFTVNTEQSYKVLVGEEEEVTLSSLDFSALEPVTLSTIEQPVNVHAQTLREAEGSGWEVFLIPYKVSGEIQRDLKLYYSSHQLTRAELDDLESSPDNYTFTSLSELEQYSSGKQFTKGKVVTPLQRPNPASPDYSVLNEFQRAGVVGIQLDTGACLAVTYKTAKGESNYFDDYLLLRSQDKSWETTCHFTQAVLDEKGQSVFRFEEPPAGIKTVDIIRVAHSYVGKGQQQLSTLKTDVSVDDLLSDGQAPNAFIRSVKATA